MYGITNKSELSNSIVGKRVDSTYLIKALFACANEGDKEAIRVLRLAGENMGRSIAGCISEINIAEPIQVILAGSVWAKATNEEMLNSFKETVIKLTNKKCDFIVLKEPPVLGAILWALELANNELPNSDLKQYVLDQVIVYQNRY